MFFSDYFQNSVLKLFFSLTDIITRKLLSLNKGEWFLNDFLIEIDSSYAIIFFFMYKNTTIVIACALK